MKATARLLLSLSLSAVCFLEAQALSLNYAEKDNTSVYISKRPDNRLFVSRAVDEEIERICTMLKNKKLAWVFSNCLPNTLDTTIRYFRIYGRHTCHVAPRFGGSGVAVYTIRQ